MSYRRNAGGGKRDIAERPIIAALEDLGCTVRQLSGKGNPDLLVRSPLGRWTPLEVKSDGGTLTKNQQAITWPVVRSAEDAIAAVLG